MKKYFIKLGTYISIIYYLDEEKNKLTYYKHHISLFAFKFETESIDFEASSKAYKDVFYVFYDGESLNKDLTYDVIVRKYLEYLLSMIDSGEVVFISELNEVDMVKRDKLNKIIQNCINKLRSENKINRKLIEYIPALNYFYSLHTNINNFDKILYLDEFQFNFYFNEESNSFIDDHHQSVEPFLDKYYSKYAHTSLANNCETFFKNKLYALKFQMLFDKEISNHIYCQDYKIEIEELGYSNYYDLSSHIFLLMDFLKAIKEADDELYIINSIINKEYASSLANKLEKLEFSLLKIDESEFMYNLFKYIYNLSVINEENRLYMNLKLYRKKSISDYFKFIEKYGFYGIFLNDTRIISENPNLKDKTLNVFTIQLPKSVKL